MPFIREANPSNASSFRIPKSFWGLALALSINFFRARFKQLVRYWKSTPKVNELVYSAEELHAISATIDAPSTYSVASSLTDASRGAGTQVRSRFITDQELLTQFANHQLWQDCVHSSGSFQWMDRGATPKNIWEEMVVRIWKDHPLIMDGTLAGYEYWCNIIRPGTPLTWHVDKDEVVYEEQGELTTPYMGAVWYGFPHEFTGSGHLELFPFHPSEVPNPEAISDLPDRLERISPHYNRLIFLNVSEWHQVAPIKNGARYTLAVNVWMHKPKSAMVQADDHADTQSIS